MSSGVKIGLTMLAPTIAIILIGSILPSSATPSINYDGLLSRSLVDAFSPYASQATAHLSLPPPKSNIDMSYIGRLCTLSMLSPVAFDILFHFFLPITRMTLVRLMVVLNSRKQADDSAKAILTQRVTSGRAKRRRGYDLYFPPKKVDKLRIKQRGNTLIPSLFFFPGFGIDHAAYSDVAARISDSGIAVAVISLEPLRLAHKALGGGIDDLRRLLRVAGKDVSRYYSESASPLIIEWNLGGHSMGGYNSLQLARDIIQQSELPSVIMKNKKSVSRVGSDIIVWAAGNIVDSVPNLRINQRPHLRVLVLNGSIDGIVKFSPQQKRELLSKLPKSTTELRTIKGANHSGFASYDTASKNSSTFALNGPRTITLEAQHNEVCSQTVRFLLDRYK
jgi:pimeloyl-ACP methyl ester carboxylesterase